MATGAEQIEPPPCLGSGIRGEFVRGIGKRDERFVIILDVDRIFSAGERAPVQGSGGVAASGVTGSGSAASGGERRILASHRADTER